MRKRTIGIVILAMAVVLIAICIGVFSPRKLLSPTAQNHIDSVTLWTADGKSQLLETYNETSLLDALKNCRMQRILGGVDKAPGSNGVFRPDWVRIELLVRTNDNLFLVLVGENQLQRRSVGYDTPVYPIREAPTLWSAVTQSLSIVG